MIFFSRWTPYWGSSTYEPRWLHFTIASRLSYNYFTFWNLKKLQSAQPRQKDFSNIVLNPGVSSCPRGIMRTRTATFSHPNHWEPPKGKFFNLNFDRPWLFEPPWYVLQFYKIWGALIESQNILTSPPSKNKQSLLSPWKAQDKKWQKDTVLLNWFLSLS